MSTKTRSNSPRQSIKPSFRLHRCRDAELQLGSCPPTHTAPAASSPSSCAGRDNPVSLCFAPAFSHRERSEPSSQFIHPGQRGRPSRSFPDRQTDRQTVIALRCISRSQRRCDSALIDFAPRRRRIRRRIRRRRRKSKSKSKSKLVGSVLRRRR